MHDAGDCANVSQTVQPLPTLPAESCDPFLCGSNGKRNHHDERTETSRNKGTLINVPDNISYREKLIEPRVRQEVHKPVEKRVKSQHTSVPYHFVPASQLAKRCDTERQQQKAQSPGARILGNVSDRICTQSIRERCKDEPSSGHQAHGKDSNF